MSLTLRIILLFTLALFWGGLTFYTGFVVRISHEVLDNPMDGGLITQQVTHLLQWLAAISVLPMAINGFVVRQQHSKFGSALLICTSILACTVAGLFFFHGRLDSVIDVAEGEITDRDAFDNGHRFYNRLTTIEWLATVAYLAVTVIAWKTIDSTPIKKPLESASSD